MTVDLELAPKQKRSAGEPCLQLVDVLRQHAGKVCVCELVPLFELSQPTVSHHLKVLREAGIVGSERRGLWAYYYVHPEAVEELSAWLSG
jgi:ArsR family transcriptional regulator